MALILEPSHIPGDLATGFNLVPTMRTWLAGPLGADVSGALDRLRTAPDVQHVAVMPDVHLAADVCVGVVSLPLRWPEWLLRRAGRLRRVTLLNDWGKRFPARRSVSTVC